MQDKVLSLIGLATKAGKIYSGEAKVENAIKNEEAKLVIIACDASDNTKKHFSDMCSYRNIPMIIYSTKEDLGNCTGKDMRSSIAVTDEGFADTLTCRIKGR